MVVTVNKINGDIVVASGTSSLRDDRDLTIEFQTSSGQVMKIKFSIQRDGGSSGIKWRGSGKELQVVLLNIPDTPGRIPEPLKVATRPNGDALFLSLSTDQAVQNQRNLTFTILERKSNST